MIKRLMDRIRKVGSPKKSKALSLEKSGRIREKCERTMAAIALAEGGAHSDARELMLQDRLVRPKILIIGKKPRFEEWIMDHVVLLASRMEHDIVAMNVFTEPGRAPGRSRADGSSSLKAFQEDAARSGKLFGEKAVQYGVSCVHLVKFGDLRKAIREVKLEVRRIEFVVTTPEVGGDEIPADAGWTAFAMNPSKDRV